MTYDLHIHSGRWQGEWQTVATQQTWLELLQAIRTFKEAGIRKPDHAMHATEAKPQRPVSSVDPADIVRPSN